MRIGDAVEDQQQRRALQGIEQVIDAVRQLALGRQRHHALMRRVAGQPIEPRLGHQRWPARQPHAPA